jgi:hypothetical protein
MIAQIAYATVGARKAHTNVRAMQDSERQKMDALSAMRARTVHSDLANAHYVRSENTVMEVGKPVRTRVLLVWRANLHLARDWTLAQIA